MNYKEIEIEATGICNAMCPSCSRHTINPTTGKWYSRKKILPQDNIDVGAFEKNFVNGLGKHTPELIQFQGSFSDPLTHPNLIELVALSASIPSVKDISVYTNGSLRTPKFFKELAKYLNTGTRKLFFSVDGLREKNAIYRKGTFWGKILENMKAFTEAGGTAMWKAVFFEQHMEDYREMEKMAMRMGFHGFQVHMNRKPLSERQIIFELSNQPDDYDPEQDTDNLPDIIGDERVTCRHLDDQYAFIGNDTSVYACCDLWGDLSESGKGTREMAAKVTQYGTPTNSLKHFKFHEIVDNKYYKEFNHSIHDNPCSLCIKNCGDDADSLEFRSQHRTKDCG
jgi:MoaA/NifB/PqqE/SkfB family radical SAM enzyme|tara:strand:- start:585 stop:1601 length:1017 start_codon:yes stop_codon:yes gene_type:complete